MRLLGDLGSDLVTMARLVQSQFRAGLTAFFQRDVRLARRVTERDDQVDYLEREVKLWKSAADTAGIVVTK